MTELSNRKELLTLKKKKKTGKATETLVLRFFKNLDEVSSTLQDGASFLRAWA